MLDNYLLVKTNPKASKENIILWHDYRITVLFDRLLRIEKSIEKKFRDNATQSFLFRNTNKQDFSVVRDVERLEIKTCKITLTIKDNFDDSFVVVDNHKEKIDNSQNLKGTYCTLDCCDGKRLIKFDCTYLQHKEVTDEVNLGYGVCSKNGVAVIDDSTSLSIDENGHIIEEIADGFDIYLFAYGDDYKGAVRDFYKISGECPLVPRFALGNWWSRYHIYTDKEYMQILNKFEEEKVPLTVATIDMDWHYSSPEDIKEKFHIDDSYNEKQLGECVCSLGWTGYSWNKDLFKDYTKFLRKINDKGLAVTLNVHPSDGVRFWEDKYKEFCNKLGIDYTTKKQIEFDICNDEFVNYYFKLLHHPYENDGVSFWWIDWQQGQKTNINGLTPLWALNHYHYLDNARNKRTPLILSRYAGVGSHRYPLGFSGDTFITWETLSFLPEFTSTASNIGYSWWSHDIGGHMRGKKDDELYVRMVELGVFSPINRLHCSNLETMTKEPWYYNNGTGLIVEKYLRLRHKLIPYLYTASWNNNKNGQALIEPLYYYNNNQEAYNYPNEYYFGGQLLVCPITTKKGKGYYSKVKTWIPEGKWTDIFTNEEYVVGSNGKKKTLHRTLENIVVLAKEGGIIPYSLDEGNSVENPHNLQIDVYNGNGEFTLYEDNAHVNKEGTFFTKFVTKKDKNSQVIEITSQGDNSVIPTNRKFRITFKNIYNGIINLYIDGVKKKVNEVNSDNTSLSINFEANREYKIIVDYTYSRLANIIRQAQVVLTEYELDNLTKYQVFNNIRSCTSIKELKNIVKTIQVKELRAKIEEWI